MEKSQTTTATKKATKRRYTLGDAQMVYGFKHIPVPRGVIEKWISELKVYPFSKPPPKSMVPFFHKLGYSRTAFENLLEKHADLKEQYHQTREMVGYNLWGRCVEGQANWPAVKFMIHDFSEDFVKARMMEKETNTQQGIVVVNMPAITKKENKA